MTATTVSPRLYVPLDPPVHRGLAKLDKSLFSLEIPVLAARLPAAATTVFTKTTAKS